MYNWVTMPYSRKKLYWRNNYKIIIIIINHIILDVFVKVFVKVDEINIYILRLLVSLVILHDMVGIHPIRKRA